MNTNALYYSIHPDQMQAVIRIVEAAQEKISEIVGIPTVVTLRHRPQDLNMDTLRILVTTVSGVSWEDIQGHSRKREYVTARFVFIYLARKYLGIVQKDLGQLLNGRDHSSIINAEQVMKDRIDINDPVTMELLTTTEEQIIKFYNAD